MLKESLLSDGRITEQNCPWFGARLTPAGLAIISTVAEARRVNICRVKAEMKRCENSSAHRPLMVPANLYLLC
jgi:hypothetical protein